jgi:TonB family protein
MPVEMPEIDQFSPLSDTVPPPRLLVELPSRLQIFWTNLCDLFVSPHLPQMELHSAPAPFWHDVFVTRGLPWNSFLKSGVFHVVAAVLVIALSRFIALQSRPIVRPAFDHTQVIYYNASEYLPSMDTRRASTDSPAKADPEYAKQPIISVPPETDNHSQTIVTPPNVKLKRDVRMPNTVAWSDNLQKPRLAIPPAPLTPAAEITRLTPRMENSIVAPPPDAAHLTHRSAQPESQTSVVAPPPDLLRSREAGALQAPQPAIVAPPPSVDSSPMRLLGEMNIGHSEVIAPAPQLPVAEQRAVRAGRPSIGAAPQVVPPPPSVSASGSAGQAGGSGRLIALNLHPAVGAPPAAPAGNRRGEFAATPQGHTGASGSPGATSGNAAGNATESNRKTTGNLPAGLYVGGAAAGGKASPVAGESSSNPASSANSNPNVAKGSGVPVHALPPESAAKLSEPERAVFGIRKLYALSVNMPNLNSSGGSWVIRFAELQPDPGAQTASLTQPVAIRTVDPGYPTGLIRENISGTVIVYGVIHADGTVGNVRVLSAVDDRLDRYACNAVSQWNFQPATKNGAPVDVEATFHIPFHPPKTQTSF